MNKLTKKPFEPMKDSDIKHLTLKTDFLLALALSGKVVISYYLVYYLMLAILFSNLNYP